MRDVSQYTIEYARAQGTIHCFPHFPQKSEFKCPKCRGKEETWAELTSVGNQKCRVIGFMQDNTFNIVFLDKDHKFYPMEKN